MVPICRQEMLQQFLRVDDNLKISNCFDSHTHLLATGQVACGLKLETISSLSDFGKLKIEKSHMQSNWLVGFGWDQHKLFSDGRWPTKQDLDLFFPNQPIYFSRIDGHSGWFNSSAEQEFKRLGFDFHSTLYKDQILFQDQKPSGILQDRAHIDALRMLPEFTNEQIQNFLITAASLFNKAGFTHVRDLSTNVFVWKQIDELLQSKKMHLCVEGNITIEDIGDLDRGLKDFETIKKIQNPYLRPKGLKVFVDGSLGSKTAALIRPYLNDSNTGKLFWSEENIQTVTEECWKREMEISFHVIGDRAADHVIKAVRKVSAKGLLGRINLEHAQILRAETINLMKPLHVTCHMQPCHWLSDKAWLSETIDSETLKNVFPWARLLKNKIQVQFGSDSPIETTSIIRNISAVEDIYKSISIERPPVNLASLHSHPDVNWTKSHTILSSKGIVQVQFDGQLLHLN